jgi:5,10-methylenetetrahydromethanopterin reductase
MDFGIAFPSYVDAWKDAEIAEANGFSHAWFYDSQLLYSDVYATMALAAEHTRSLKLGTLVAIPSNRITPVTASAIATINAIAPGRVILGLGTGFTGRNTMGLPALPVAALVEYSRQVRTLLAGEDVLFREGRRERWIRLLHPARSRGFLNLDDPIPIHIAANGPKALAAVAEAGDAWITAAQIPETIPLGLAAIADAAKSRGKSFPGSKEPAKPYTTMLSSGCVLRDGESLDSARVMARVGPLAVVASHAAWESAHGGAGFGISDDETARSYGEYIDRYAAERGSPADRRYLDVHEGHMVFLKEGEERFVREDAVKLITLTGRPDEVLERVRALRDAGVDNLAVQALPGLGRDLIEEFSKYVIARL